MKKNKNIILAISAATVLIAAVICIILFTGGSDDVEDGNYNTSNSISEKTNQNKNNTNVANEANNALKDPILEWCQLYNPNGYDTVTCVISNPNSVDIDISYDLVYYKDGKEVARTDEQWSNFQISPTHSDVIWGNYDIPSANDVDEVKMENITVTKASETSINAEISYVETVGGKAYFSVKNDTTPTLNTVWIFEYNDDNNNNKCDKGELVVANAKSVMEKESKISIDTDVYKHDAYEIYYNAY